MSFLKCLTAVRDWMKSHRLEGQKPRTPERIVLLGLNNREDYCENLSFSKQTPHSIPRGTNKESLERVEGRPHPQLVLCSQLVLLDSCEKRSSVNLTQVKQARTTAIHNLIQDSCFSPFPSSKVHKVLERISLGATPNLHVENGI